MTSQTQDPHLTPRHQARRPTEWFALSWFSSPLASSVLLGFIGFLISFAGAWVPSPWLDEAATAHIISYPLADMERLWERTDAVFAPYYIAMKAWVAVTGITPLSLRMPSLLAVGAGTAAMAAAGRHVGGPKSQLLYAACFALLPRVTAMGIEARPYAISAMFLAFALLLVLKLSRRNSPFYWPLLGLSMIGAIAAHLFSVLPVLGLIAVALFLFSGRRRVALLITSAAAGIACLPLAIVALPQKTQVSWLADAGYSIGDQALVEAWFTSRWNINPAGVDIPLNSVALALAILSALTFVIALAFGRPLPKGRLVLAAVPPALTLGALWGISLAQEPMLLGRYLTSSTPFFAMLVAECMLLLRRRPRQIIASLLVIGCIFLIAAQRQPYAKIPGNDYSFIAAALHDGAHEGDGLLIEPGLGPVDAASNAKDLYPQEFSRLLDIAQPQAEPLSHVFAADPPLVDVTQRPLPPRIWLVTKLRQDSKYAAQLTGLGYAAKSSSSGPAHTVTLWTQP